MGLLKSTSLLIGGAIAGVAASRLLPPFLAQLQTNADPFQPLIDDHRYFLKLLGKMEITGNGDSVLRIKLLALLKRALGKHAMAEEDVVYPALHDRANKAQASKQLYDEHADIKIILYELEQNVKDAGWAENASRLKMLISDHARQEEEVEFPALREIMKKKEPGQMARAIKREEALVL